MLGKRFLRENTYLGEIVMFIDSICPKYGEINHVEHKGEEVLLVTCKNHMYDHIVMHYPRKVGIKLINVLN